MASIISSKSATVIETYFILNSILESEAKTLSIQFVNINFVPEFTDSRDYDGIKVKFMEFGFTLASGCPACFAKHCVHHHVN